MTVITTRTRIARSFLVLGAAASLLAVPTSAMAMGADLPISGGGIVDPQPDPQPQPQPGPGDIAIPDGGDKPQGPGDIAIPDGGDKPQGPGDIAIPDGGDKPQGPGDIAIPDGGDKPQGPGDLTAPEGGGTGEDTPKGEDAPGSQGDGTAVAGAADVPTAEAVAAEGELPYTGAETWIVAGLGALLMLAGASSWGIARGGVRS